MAKVCYLKSKSKLFKLMLLLRRRLFPPPHSVVVVVVGWLAWPGLAGRDASDAIGSD